MIFNSSWTALMGLVILAGPSHPYKEWTTPLGFIMFLPSGVTVVALVATSAWFQRLIKNIRKAKTDPAAGQ